MHPVNTLYYGDNLEVLRKHIGEESVDLIYLDPPFNSQRDYNLLFREQSGEPAQAQIKAFTDTWQWSERAYVEFCETCPLPALVELLQGFVRTLGRNEVTAYLVMMAPRLVELHRVLKPTGSLYLHCDPTASHYLKVMLDVIFGARNFRNEIVWVRDPAGKGAKKVSRQWPRNIDILLFYTKSENHVFYQQFKPLSEEQKRAYRYQDERGRYKAVQTGDYTEESLARLEKEGRIHYSSTGKRYVKYYLDEAHATVGAVWDDIYGFGTRTAASEFLGYPTQKPLALLERIIQASSNEGDVVLDPFCGCGTAVVAAHKLKRRWIGIDITHLAIALIKYRLSDMFDLKEGKDYRVIGEPTTVDDARALALQDRDEFQKWAIGLIPRAFPYQQKKGADTGVDGMLYFTDNPREHPKKVVIQVKSGRVGVKDIRDFRGVLEREKATLGLFVTLEPPTRDMVREAEQAGFYTTPLGNIRLQRLQIRTIEDLLQGRGFDIPSAALLSGVQTAERVSPTSHQPELEM
ncbi:site-specific DNA-methyltransferase (adenine-specific) [Armatimonadetes bacterium DC]|nr:site-specific DNA-methyltransferase (adenine-specific) [Armatimonadetes bacterium DC]